MADSTEKAFLEIEGGDRLPCLFNPGDLQVSRANGARPSIRRYSLYGVMLVPLTLCASLLVTRL